MRIETGVPIFPKSQKQNLFEQLRDDLLEANSAGETYYSAFREVSLKWLGYEKDTSPTIVDASRDRGFDAYRISRNEVDIFQFKSQDFTKKVSLSTPADADALKDIKRILSLLQSKDFSEEIKNRKLKKFIYQLQTAVESGTTDADEIFIVRINLVALYDGLTPTAQSELKLLTEQHGVIKLFNRDVLVEINYLDINNLLGLKWRETNTSWVDATGQASDWITIHYAQSGAPGFIGDRSSLIFYGRARDLIDAYRRFGYQIFESNVRCEIVKSQVNDAIRNQVATQKGIDEFRILNNGITIVCENKKRPSNGKVEVHQPQIVNGLQTVTSLYEAHAALSTSLQSYFDENCYVLVRIYDRQQISDIPKLVKATNNQNKMEQRNLRSNDADQVSFERAFAKLGWFYERKDFAWTAFDRSENQWTTLKGYKARDFKVQGKQGRPIIRKADNQDVGQHWLAFIGYVDDAAQRRRLIFEDERYYGRIFQTRMVKPAYDYNFDFSNAKIDEESILSAPSPDSMLLAHLTYRLAKENVATSAKVRDQVIQQRGYDGLSEDEIDARLTKDPEYICGLALSAGPFLFTEMCGLLFLRAFGNDFYNGKAKKLLEKTDMKAVFNNLDFEPIKKKVADKQYEIQDLFSTLWLLFHNVVLTELAESDQWTNAFFTESSKPRIMYREATRRKILDRVLELDNRSKKRALNYDFSDHFDNHGILKHIQRVADDR